MLRIIKRLRNYMQCCNNMELTKEDNQMAKGLAIIGMVALHLFCRLGKLPYTPVVYIGGTPLIYYIGLFGDLCVPIYCFCSGYAHYLLMQKHGEKYPQVMLRKIGSFLKNYWVVLILFTFLGLLFDKTNTIPGSLGTFLGNFFLVKMNYNGAWWFVLTYIILTIISPIIIKIVNRIDIMLLVVISGGIYFICYIFRFVYSLPISSIPLSWLWNQTILVGTSQFAYIVGMLCRKENVITCLKKRMGDLEKFRKIIILVFPMVLFCFHCVIQSAIVAPITGLGTLICFYLWNKPKWIEKTFLFLGKHSTNIWLIHMFFYARLFTNFVFVAKYPILIFALMMSVCIGVSYIIQKCMLLSDKICF